MTQNAIAELDKTQVRKTIIDNVKGLVPIIHQYDPETYTTGTFYPSPLLASFWIESENFNPITAFFVYIQNHPRSLLPQIASIDFPDTIEFAIYSRFYDIDQVHAIYVQDLPEVYKVFVTLAQKQYDDELMDTLLDLEAEIMDLYPDQLFHFHYWPLLDEEQPRLMARNAVQILSRKWPTS